eukprot:TRINITY_DN9023_c1_g1_i4.p1 TRINITY_DN9023_c1_g1~~TRINITY_DN9023_c1_g1_i4.p1  ORF type:complete len:189 (+),score=47.41 TRINITY_DN9023_c1_g1_i4:34-567(+)
MADTHAQPTPISDDPAAEQASFPLHNFTSLLNIIVCTVTHHPTAYDPQQYATLIALACRLAIDRAVASQIPAITRLIAALITSSHHDDHSPALYQEQWSCIYESVAHHQSMTRMVRAIPLINTTCTRFARGLALYTIARMIKADTTTIDISGMIHAWSPIICPYLVIPQMASLLPPS